MVNKENFRLNDEEREILERIDREELVSVPDVEKEIEFARQAARNTLNKMNRTTDDETEIDSG